MVPYNVITVRMDSEYITKIQNIVPYATITLRVDSEYITKI